MLRKLKKGCQNNLLCRLKVVTHLIHYIFQQRMILHSSESKLFTNLETISQMNAEQTDGIQ